MGHRRLGVHACVSVALAATLALRVTAQTPDKLVYADFESVQDGRPVSSRGGTIYLFGYSENPTLQPTIKGVDGLTPPAPQLVRIKPEDPNRLAKFDFELPSPNRYAGVILEVKGQADKGGQPLADDVTGYKNFVVEVFATGAKTMRIELLSRGFGMDMEAGWPQVTFLPKQGLNTYRIPLKTFAQPSWVSDTRIDPKDLFKKLTAVNISAYCDECRPATGMVVVDNVVFEK